MNPTLLVMAAGMGSRYGGLKQVEPFGPNGETLLDYSVYDALRAGISRVVFIIRRDFEGVFRERVGARFEGRVDVDYVFQDLSNLPGDFRPVGGREKPWGTAHAAWSAADVIKGPFVAINADDFYGRDAYAQLAGFFQRAASGPAGDWEAPPLEAGAGIARFAMAGYRLADTLSEHGAVSRGVCRVDGRNRLESIEELTGIESAPAGAGRVRLAGGHERLLPPDTLVSMNCWGFDPSVFPLLEDALERFLAARGADPKAECYLPAAIAEAINGGRASVDVLPVAGKWFGITHRDDKPRVVAALEKLIKAGDYPARLWPV